MIAAANPYDTQPPKPPAMPKPPNSGLVQGAMQNAATATATTRAVDRPTGTVQGQMDSILSKDGPMFARARAQALEQYNGRGLVNTSMASEGALGAVIDRALPIAQQDASIYDRVASENMSATNQVDMFNAGEKNTFGRQALDQDFQAGQRATDRAYGTSEREAGQAFQSGERAADRTFQTGERVAGQTFQSGERAADRTFQSGERVAGQEFQSGERAADRTFQTGERQAGQDFTASENQRGRDQQREMFTLEQQAADKRLTQQHANALEQMGYQNKLSTANVPTTFAANIAASTMDRVNAVLADPNLDPAGKKAAVDNIVAYANSTLELAEKLYGTTAPRITAPATRPGSDAGPAPAAPGAPGASATPAGPPGFDNGQAGYDFNP